MRAEKWSCSSIIIRVVNFDGAFSGAKSRGWVALAFHPPVVVISTSRHQCVKCGVHPSRSPVGVISQQVLGTDVSSELSFLPHLPAGISGGSMLGELSL